MKPSDHSRAEAFGDFILAAMLDAAIERKMTQLKTEITPEKTGRVTQVRIIIVPETMDEDRPQGFGKISP